MSMADLVAAGAPELPEGWFYRVRPALLPGMVRVEIRRRRFVGSEEVERSVGRLSQYPTALDAVVESCRYAHRRWREREECHLDASALYGDHDPKGGR
ncbi:hypothetical protein ADL27_38485 [Streptomyces sp. NRRL F-6602]|nr:hypothetical protein ADL27_38485 [Streptomyces sp. NRRL F-6602]